MTKERLEQLKEVLDMTRKLISIDIYYCIYDTDCIVQYIYPEDGDKDGIHIGTKFVDPTGKLEEVLATEKHIHNFIPMDRFGFYMEGNLIPVYENGELCGAISSAYVPMNQQQLAARELAVQAVYNFIMSVDLKNKGHCNRLYFDYEKQPLPMDAQHFDDFCEKMVPYVHPDDVKQFLAFTEMSKVWQMIQNERTSTMECRLLNASEEYRWAELMFTREDEFQGVDVYNSAVFMIRDIHDRKSKELDMLEQLERNNELLFEQGMTDELTKLYNRKGHVWFGEHLLKSAKRSERYIYALVADLNGLKYINDKFGHEEGDRAIRTIADLLRQTAPESAIVSRTGGDEFIVLALLEKDSPLPDVIDRKLQEGMEKINADSGLEYPIEASYGWDLRLASEVSDLDDCTRLADERMYDMKAHRRLSGRVHDSIQKVLDEETVIERQQVFLLSPDKELQKEIAPLFASDNYLFLYLENEEIAEEELTACTESMLLLVDNRQEVKFGLRLVASLPQEQQKNVIPVLLLAEENEDTIADAFSFGIEDILIEPFNTVLNKCRVQRLLQRAVANQRFNRLLEEQEK